MSASASAALTQIVQEAAKRAPQVLRAANTSLEDVASTLADTDVAAEFGRALYAAVRNAVMDAAAEEQLQTDVRSMPDERLAALRDSFVCGDMVELELCRRKRLADCSDTILQHVKLARTYEQTQRVYEYYRGESYGGGADLLHKLKAEVLCPRPRDEYGSARVRRTELTYLAQAYVQSADPGALMQTHLDAGATAAAAAPLPHLHVLDELRAVCERRVGEYLGTAIAGIRASSSLHAFRQALDAPLQLVLECVWGDAYVSRALLQPLVDAACARLPDCPLPGSECRNAELVELLDMVKSLGMGVDVPAPRRLGVNPVKLALIQRMDRIVDAVQDWCMEIDIATCALFSGWVKCSSIEQAGRCSSWRDSEELVHKINARAQQAEDDLLSVDDSSDDDDDAE